MSLAGRLLKPLAWDSRNRLLVYGGAKLYFAEKDALKEICSLPLGGPKRLLAKSRFATRALRIEPRAALCLDDIAIVTWMGSVLSINASTGEAIELMPSRSGFSAPLYFTKSIDSNALAYWGDYGRNENGDAVNVYALLPNNEVKVVYSFPSRAIRHIHGIIPRGLGGYYVFTGDMEPSSGIYIANEDFSHVEALATGEQKYRAVRGFSLGRDLFYATDSASIKNHLFRLTECDSGTGYALTDLGVINGPCIYGCQCEGGFLFTTTVEPDESLRGLKKILSVSIGPGVLSNEATAVFVDSSGIAKEVKRIKTDGMPLALLQYGALIPPAGKNIGNEILVYARSLEGHDGKIVGIGLR